MMVGLRQVWVDNLIAWIFIDFGTLNLVLSYLISSYLILSYLIACFIVIAYRFSVLTSLGCNFSIFPHWKEKNGLTTFIITR